MNENRYLIGQFANILGIDADTIRYYEKQGIIHSKRDDANNYRYYTDTDCRDLLQCRFLRSLGFSIRQIKENKCDLTTEAYREFLKKREQELQKEEQYLHNVRKQVALYRKAAEIWHEHRDTIWIENEKRTYLFFRQTEETVLLSSSLSTDLTTKLMKLMPLTFQAGIYLQESLTEEKITAQDSSAYFECGLMIDQEMIENDRELCTQKPDRVIRWDSCCHMILSGNYEIQQMTVSRLLPMLRFIEVNQYEVCGDAVGRILPTSVADGKWFILNSIPIKKKEERQHEATDNEKKMS